MSDLLDDLRAIDDDVAEDAVEEIVRLCTRVDELQSGMYINCVYCGHYYGPDDETPESMADVIREHIEQCPKHPMSVLRIRVDQAIAVVKNLQVLQSYQGHAASVQQVLSRVLRILENGDE
jgi:hypothetical protein